MLIDTMISWYVLKFQWSKQQNICWTTSLLFGSHFRTWSNIEYYIPHERSKRNGYSYTKYYSQQKLHFSLLSKNICSKNSLKVNSSIRIIFSSKSEDWSSKFGVEKNVDECLRSTFNPKMLVTLTASSAYFNVQYRLKTNE